MEANLVLLKNDGERKIFPLSGGITIIGRRHDCDLQVRLKSVSRRHCQINQSKGAWQIRDLGSRNGTIINGQPVKEAVIEAGDSFNIGPLSFMLQVGDQPGLAQNKPQRDAAQADATAEVAEATESATTQADFALSDEELSALLSEIDSTQEDED